MRVSDSKAGVDVTQDVTVLAPISDGAVSVDWDHATEAGLALADLESTPTDGAQFGAVPSAASKAKSYETWNKDFSGWLFRTQKVDLLKSPSAKQNSKPGESERDFRVRLQQSGREARDKSSDSLRQKYAPKITALQDRIRRAGQMVERQQAESRVESNASGDFSRCFDSGRIPWAENDQRRKHRPGNNGDSRSRACDQGIEGCGAS